MIQSLLRLLHRIEDALLVALLIALIAIAAYQVLARNLFDGGLLWGDALVRVLVFWVTLVGAMVAARGDEHIKIDVVSRFLGRGSARVAQVVASLFAAVVCALLGYASLDLIRFEYEDGTIAFASVPAWLCQVVLPVGAWTMALRYFLRTFAPVRAADQPLLGPDP
ncbi:MAG: TRAP transporter small permease [Pseudomonadales bacterium]